MRWHWFFSYFSSTFRWKLCYSFNIISKVQYFSHVESFRELMKTLTDRTVNEMRFVRLFVVVVVNEIIIIFFFSIRSIHAHPEFMKSVFLAFFYFYF